MKYQIINQHGNVIAEFKHEQDRAICKAALEGYWRYTLYIKDLEQ